LIELFVFMGSVHAQSLQTPPHIDDLVKRASALRQLLAAGDRVKASELVVATKRKDFLNKPPASLENFRIVGIDFIDKDRISVRLTGQTVMSGGEGAQLTEPQVSDVWKYEKGMWYFQPDSGDVPFSAVFKNDPAADAVALAEIKSSFKLLTQSVDVGETWQGDHKDFPVKFQYDGKVPIRIVSKLDSPVTMIDTASTQWITKDSNQFKVTAGSEDFEGPFDIPVAFTVYYKSVALDQSIRVKGDIRPVFKYRQVPGTVPADSKEEFQVFLTNNTDEPAELGAFSTEGKFYVTKYPHHLAAGEEGVITLKRNPAAGVSAGTIVSIDIDNHLKGKQVCEIRIH
jgi:hypothetical protein